MKFVGWIVKGDDEPQKRRGLGVVAVAVVVGVGVLVVKKKSGDHTSPPAVPIVSIDDVA